LSLTADENKLISSYPFVTLKEMIIAFAQTVEKLQGLYTAAEDVGCSLEDVTLMSQHTRYVVGVSHKKSSGNPAPFTGWGTYRGIQATLQKIFGTDSVQGKTIAIWRVSFTIPPQSGSGGGRPRPKNPRTPMVMMTYPRRRQASTISGPRALGKISNSMILQSDSPRVWAAAT